MATACAMLLTERPAWGGPAARTPSGRERQISRRRTTCGRAALSRASIVSAGGEEAARCARLRVRCAAGEPAPLEMPLEMDSRGLTRLVLKKEGWRFWDCTLPGEDAPRRMHYVQAGSAGPPIVLVHGFGASAYHWRYNIPELAKSHRVYAPCLLGFGWSEKAVVDYTEGRVRCGSSLLPPSVAWRLNLGDEIPPP
mmetsp:Transcript_7924/g.20153  ORF Transcript_7924/g.20153 Transcript_7924/m.20153 type:complete len:196 (-) Transcript_7924:853-1440(-)